MRSIDSNHLVVKVLITMTFENLLFTTGLCCRHSIDLLVMSWTRSTSVR
jgi:hypothetical protein